MDQKHGKCAIRRLRLTLWDSDDLLKLQHQIPFAGHRPGPLERSWRQQVAWMGPVSIKVRQEIEEVAGTLMIVDSESSVCRWRTR
jgi:hypothetical protein